jgi:ion channel POLLUX/CASTOR
MKGYMKLKERINYLIDNFVSKGTGYLMLGLFVVTIAVVLAIGLVAGFVDGFKESLAFYLWNFFHHSLSPGLIFRLFPDKGVLYIILAFIATYIGIFFLSFVISFVSRSFQSKVTDLTKGRGKILEKNHTLIIGDSNSVPTIVGELVTANESEKKSFIVILSKNLPEVVFKKIKETVPSFKNTKVIVRSGSALVVEDLEMCAIKDAKKVIIAHDNDIDTIKTIVNINQTPFVKNELGYITTQVFEKENLEIIKEIIPGKIEAVYIHDLKARVFARTCIQPGSSMVYKDLFGFEGSEIYFEPLVGKLAPLVGKKFSQAITSVVNGYVIGLVRDGKELVNADRNLILNSNDELIVISEDNGLVAYQDNQALIKEFAVETTKIVEPQLNLLFIGFNKTLPAILDEINSYKLEKNRIHIMVKDEKDKENLSRLFTKNQFKEFEISIGSGKKINDLARLKLQDFNVVSVFANNYDTKLTKDELDSESLLTILNLHNLENKLKVKLNIVTEILNESNVNIINNVSIDDFMISDLLISRIVTLVAENRKVLNVINDLVTEEGSELYLKRAQEYVPLDQSVNCASLVAATAKKNQLFIGYKLHKQSPVINPKLDSSIKFGANDSLIVVSED